LITQLSVRLDKRTLHVAVTENGKKSSFIMQRLCTSIRSLGHGEFLIVIFVHMRTSPVGATNYCTFKYSTSNRFSWLVFESIWLCCIALKAIIHSKHTVAKVYAMLHLF